MSKIQKALNKLRTDKEGSNVAAKNRESSINKGSVSGSPRSDSAAHKAVRVRGRTPLELETVEEHLPEFRVEVDFAILDEQGLMPKEMDADTVAEQFRRIKRPILHLAFGIGMPDSENANVIMVASALPKTGKSFCSFHLANSIAIERDVGAVLVDADVLKPNISRAFGVDQRVGLIDYLLDSSVSIDDILVMTDLNGIIVIPSGRQHPEATELLASRRMKKLVEALSKRFAARGIIVDTPPLLMTNEAHVLAEHMGQIVLIIEAGVSPQESITQVLNSLNRTKPINAILNKARSVSFGSYDGGGYGYHTITQRGRKYADDID